jgi:TPR repeat protein
MNHWLVPTLMAWAACAAHAATPIDAAVAAYERGDIPHARMAFERLAGQGVAAADFNLAVMHLRHQMPRSSDREAVRLMTRSAEAGFVTAMVALAELHELGQAGLAVDLPKSVLWQQRAAEAGSVEAQVELATAYYLGRGVAHDATQAARWYRLAAQGGDVGAMYLYASMLEAGDGVERDLIEARNWYATAARLGDRAAPGKVQELEARLAKPAS